MCNIKATVYYHDNSTGVIISRETNSVNVLGEYPTSSEILAGKLSNGKTVLQCMHDTWESQKKVENANATHCRELGFVIYLVTTPTGSYYECPLIPPMPLTPYMNGASIDLTGRYVDNTNYYDLNVGGRFFVADFHTHPPLCRWTKIGYREVTPSKEDEASAKGRGIPCYLYDYVGVPEKNTGIYYHHSNQPDQIDAPARLSNYGSNQRTN